AIYTINAGGLPLYIGPTAASNLGSFSFSSASSLTPIQSSIQRIQEATNQQLSSVSIVAITQQQNDGLRDLAEKTGGSFVRSTNLAKLLEKTAEDQKGYYLLGYSPDEETFSKEFKDAKFHKLIVKVKKPGLKVRSRSGFYGFADQAVDEEIEISVTEQLTQALTSPFNSSDIGVKLSATVLDTDKEQRYLQALIHIDPTNIKFDKKSDQFYEASIDVATVLFGNNGLLVDKEFNNLTIQLDEEGLQNAYRNGIVQTTTLPVKNDGSYFLKVVVRDTSTSKLGTTGQTVEAFNSSDRFFVSAIAVAGSDYNQNNPLSGPAVRKFKKDAVVDFGYYVYNPQLDKLSQKPNLQAEAVIYKDGKEVFRSQKSSVRIDEIVSLKQYLVGGQLSFSNSFAKGNYILQIIIEDSNVKKSKQQNNIVSQQTDFETID
ncbi:MAG: hypothetical protein JNN15_16650, partial [Blastocatellia bacterium]|nr:hypothetical protein [Blastocatellia bacterium]